MQLATKDAELAALQSQAASLRTQEHNAASKQADAQKVYDEARRIHQQVKDEEAAGVIFRKLRPICCPACEAGIDAQRYESASKHDSCPLCGTHEAVDAQHPSQLNELSADVKDAEAALRHFETSRKFIKDKLTAVDNQRHQVDLEIQDIQSKMKDESSAAIELQLHAHEAKIEELSSLVLESSPTLASLANDHPILEATYKVTKGMFDEQQREVSRDLVDDIKRISVDIGLQNVQEMSIDNGGKLLIKQGGANLYFAGLVAGEKLRVRIAASIALILVAKKRGYGRHPGLLVLDSPRSEEITDKDFCQIVDGLARTQSSHAYPFSSGCW